MMPFGGGPMDSPLDCGSVSCSISPFYSEKKSLEKKSVSVFIQSFDLDIKIKGCETLWYEPIKWPSSKWRR